MPQPVDIAIQRSRQQLVWLVAIHSIALILLLNVQLPVYIRLPLVSVVAVGALWQLRRWKLPGYQHLVFRNDQWLLGSGNDTQVVELDRWHGLGKLLVLQFKGLPPLVLFPDSIDRPSYSQLRQRLRLGGG